MVCLSRNLNEGVNQAYVNRAISENIKPGHSRQDPGELYVRHSNPDIQVSGGSNGRDIPRQKYQRTKVPKHLSSGLWVQANKLLCQPG